MRELMQSAIIKKPDTCDECPCYAHDSDNGGLCQNHKFDFDCGLYVDPSPDIAFRNGSERCIFVRHLGGEDVGE